MYFRRRSDEFLLYLTFIHLSPAGRLSLFGTDGTVSPLSLNLNDPRNGFFFPSFLACRPKLATITYLAYGVRADATSGAIGCVKLIKMVKHEKNHSLFMVDFTYINVN